MLDAPSDGAIAELAAELRPMLGDRISSGPSILDQHAGGEAYHAPVRPQLVAFPTSTAEVSAILRACAARRVPVTPYAVGSSLEGHVVPVAGGLSLDMMRMDKVLAVHEQDLDAVVQPGVTRERLNAALRGQGLMFTVDPGADASIGGMAATRASGTNAVRYGTMRDVVLGLEVVLASGEVIRTGGRARKSSSGYDLTRLFVGSEGTLGVITELTVRLAGAPEAVSAATCAFESVGGAVDAVIQAIQIGLPVARIELLDPVQIRAVNAYSDLGLPERPHLFLEFHGSAAGVAEQTATFGEIAAEHGALGFEWATRTEDRSRLWKARHDAYWACRAFWSDRQGYVTDVCVPISALAGAIAATQADIAEFDAVAPLVGHVGDGNFHLQIMIDPNRPADLANAKEIARRAAERAIAAGGTVTGEHGVGQGKIDLMAQEHGPGAVAAMAAIKAALDPLGIMNPGKILPPT